MQAHRWLYLVAAILALSACEQNSIAMTGPTVEHLWLGPDVVAGPEEIASLAHLAADPVVREVSSAIGDDAFVTALEAFGAGIHDDPGTSFLSLELSLGSLYSSSTLPSGGAADAAIVHEMLDLYRDHAAITLFGIDRSALGPLTQPNGS